MQELLIGRWQAYKFTLKGSDTWYDKGMGNLYQFHPDGKVDLAYRHNGEWIHDAVPRVIKEVNGETRIAEPDRDTLTVLSLNQHEMQLGVVENYGKPILIYYLKRLV